MNVNNSAKMNGVGERTERGKTGFTLVEMLITVAVIAILIAIAIPTISGIHDRARRKACEANRRSFRSVLYAAYLDGDARTTDEMEALFESGLDYYTCPAGGKWTLVYNEETGGARITCDKHGDGGDESQTYPLSDSRNLTGIYNALVKSGKYSSMSMDSTAFDAKGSSTSAFVAALKDGGFDMKALGANSWYYDKDSHTIYWTSGDVAALDIKAGGSETVVMMGYTFAGSDGASGTYSVANVTIGNKTAHIGGQNNYTYNYVAKVNPTGKNMTFDDALSQANK